MPTPRQTVIDLERAFWQSMLDADTDTAVSMLCEPALMVSQHGALKFDHATYRKMAEQGSMVLTAFELRDIDVVFPNDDTAVVTYGVDQSVAPRPPGKGQPVKQRMQESSTWVREDGRWRCAIHTETPLRLTGVGAA